LAAGNAGSKSGSLLTGAFPTGLSWTESRVNLEATDAVAMPLLEARLLCEPVTDVKDAVSADLVVLGRLDVAVDVATDVRLTTLARLATPGFTVADDILFDAVPMKALLDRGTGASNVGKLPRCKGGFGTLMTAAALAPLGAREVLAELVVDCEVFLDVTMFVAVLIRGLNVEGRAATAASDFLAWALGAILEVDGDGSSTGASLVLLTTGALVGRSLAWETLRGGGAVLDTVDRMVFMTLAAPDRRSPNRPDGATLTGATDLLLAALPPILLLPFELRRDLAAFFKAASFSWTVAIAAVAFSAFNRSAPSTRWRFGGGGAVALFLGSSRQMTRRLVLLRDD
jgi:hypothetical protein